MKGKNILVAFAVVAIALLTSCQQNKTSGEFTTQTFSASDSLPGAVTEVEIDYPTGGPQVLVDSIRAWIIQLQSEGYTGDVADGQAFVDFVHKQSSDALVDAFNGMRADIEVDESDPEADGMFNIPNEDRTSLKLEWQNDDFVTYGYTFFLYSSGAAHGIEGSYGTTFFKQDGTRLTWADVRGADTEEFQAILREGLKAYLEVETDEELADNVFLPEGNDIYHIPLPNTDPCVREGGIEFYYGEYEVASYSCGTPSFVVPFDRIHPFMSERVMRILDTYPESPSQDITTGRTEMY